MARTLQELLNGVSLTGSSDQLSGILAAQTATPRTEEELRAAAERAVGSLYNEKELAAQQQYARTSQGLKNQLDTVGYAYDIQKQDAEKNIRLALSQTDNRSRSRGMGRSSYTEATLGNIQLQGNQLTDRINTAKTNTTNDISGRLALADEQLGELLSSYKTNREVDILGRIDEMRATDLKDSRAAIEYNNGLIMALAARMAEEKERERMLALQERELAMKQAAYAAQSAGRSGGGGGYYQSGNTNKIPEYKPLYGPDGKMIVENMGSVPMETAAFVTNWLKASEKYRMPSNGNSPANNGISYNDAYKNQGGSTLMQRFNNLSRA